MVVLVRLQMESPVDLVVARDRPTMSQQAALALPVKATEAEMLR